MGGKEEALGGSCGGPGSRETSQEVISIVHVRNAKGTNQGHEQNELASIQLASATGSYWKYVTSCQTVWWTLKGLIWGLENVVAICVDFQSWARHGDIWGRDR